MIKGVVSFAFSAINLLKINDIDDGEWRRIQRPGIIVYYSIVFGYHSIMLTFLLVGNDEGIGLRSILKEVGMYIKSVIGILGWKGKMDKGVLEKVVVYIRDELWVSWNISKELEVYNRVDWGIWEALDI